jgi:hypothetical protein
MQRELNRNDTNPISILYNISGLERIQNAKTDLFYAQKIFSFLSQARAKLQNTVKLLWETVTYTITFKKTEQNQRVESWCSKTKVGFKTKCEISCALQQENVVGFEDVTDCSDCDIACTIAIVSCMGCWKYISAHSLLRDNRRSQIHEERIDDDFS